MPTTPVAVSRLLITGGGGLLIVKTSVSVSVPPALVAEIVMLEVPAVVGVPEMTPVVVLMLSPAGRPVAP